MKSKSSLLCSQKLFTSSTPHHLFISMIHFQTTHRSMSSYPKCSVPLQLSVHMYCIFPVHATYSLFTQRSILTGDNWCSIVCRLKSPCCFLRTTVPQELDPVHTVPTHQGKHCSINTAKMIYDHKRFTTLQLCWISSIVWRTVHVHRRCPVGISDSSTDCAHALFFRQWMMFNIIVG